MAFWRVHAFGPDGAEGVEMVEAVSRDQALSFAARQGKSVFRIELGAATAPATPLLRPADMAALIGEIAALSRAQVPLPEALASIAGHSSRKPVREAAGLLKTAVERGDMLSVAMTDQIGAPMEISGALAAGEAQGDVASALMRLEAGLGRRLATASAIRGALIYPAILLLVTLISLAIILFGVTPNLAPLFARAGDAAPASAKALLAMSAFAQSYGEGLLAALGVAALAGIRLQRLAPVRAAAQRAMLRSPLVGPLLRASETAVGLRAAAGVIEGGAPAPDALDLAATSVRTAEIAAAFRAISDDLREGRELATAFADRPALAPGAAGIVAIGARTGDLPRMMIAAAERQEREVDEGAKRIVAILPPAMTLALGLLVGGFSIAVLSAILSVNDLAL